MSISERSPSTSSFGEITPYDPTQVAGYNRLVARLSERPADDSDDALSVDVDAYEPGEPSVSDILDEVPGSTEQHSVLTASSRVGRLLQRLSDRLENGAEHADTTIDYVTRTGKTAVRGIGRAAVAGTELAVGTTLLTANATARGVKRFGDASGDAMIAGFNKVETAMDKTGDAIDARATNVKNKYQTFQFNRETKANDRQFRKEYARETKAFDKNAKVESKAAAKQDKIDLKQAGREDARFERSMRKKEAQERKDARHAKWASRLNSLKSTGASGVEATKDAVKSSIDTSRDFAEKSKQRARVTRMAGKMALQTYRDSKESFKTT